MYQEKYNDSMEMEEIYDDVRLSPIGLLAYDIIIKEFSNVFHQSYIDDDSKYILQADICQYLNGKEAYQLTYTSKKAIDIIRHESKNNISAFQAIQNKLNNRQHTAINKKRYIESNSSVNTKKLRI